ncbi:MAG: 2-succinyl-5-enolpyruvyl-6-hydroxy-3-cyclohexene-1-carboxylic-acid synthase [Alkalinema sp. RU_4_3]|nr:2-succinyl-5-enolpyruvyl-6-hydroxy-3-cyclohexene-1-carboxylic-acid synthase [Alkalinema sp. RU_4_3]
MATLDFRNLNTLWSSVLAETLYCMGLRQVVVCPGSRSAPLAVAFAQHPGIEAIPILDERSASFFALGLARRSQLPVALVCSSGTAGANFFPAVIEAKETAVPLLVLTADRPPELRDCNAGQAIDQQKLFGTFVNYYGELAIPELRLLPYLRQRLAQAYRQTLYPNAGVVHLNLPLRDPLAPIVDEAIAPLSQTFPPDFFQHLPGAFPSSTQRKLNVPGQGRRGVIIAGVAQVGDPERYCQAIAQMSSNLGFPVLAEGLSPLRNFAALQPYLISTYDAILRNGDRALALQPEVVVRLGGMPTSKVLRAWLIEADPEIFIFDRSPRSIDPLQGRTVQIPMDITDVVLDKTSTTPSDYVMDWMRWEKQVRSRIDQTFESLQAPIESKVAWLLSCCLPIGTPLFISNSMPVRDVEWFWQPGDRRIIPYFNRGANGIDGILSTALGVAHGGQAAVLLTGDLALLYDTNGFLIGKKFKGSLTIVLVNNNGGGIFGMLPIAQFEPPFEDFFATPQDVAFSDICQTYGVDYCAIEDWKALEQALQTLLPQGVRLLEVKSDRAIDAAWRKEKLAEWAE